MKATRQFPPPGPLPRPKSPDGAAHLLKKYAQPASSHLVEVTIECDEFTSLCPATKQPDFGTVRIVYKPREKLLESKAVKVYLGSFREKGMLCEDIAHFIGCDVYAGISPLWVEVTVTQKPRGGIALSAKARLPVPT